MDPFGIIIPHYTTFIGTEIFISLCVSFILSAVCMLGSGRKLSGSQAGKLREAEGRKQGGAGREEIQFVPSVGKTLEPERDRPK